MDYQIEKMSDKSIIFLFLPIYICKYIFHTAIHIYFCFSPTAVYMDVGLLSGGGAAAEAAVTAVIAGTPLDKGSVQARWVLPYVPGKSLGQRPL